MSEPEEPNSRTVYCIRIQGILDEKWADWFDGFAIRPRVETVLVGPVADQADLHGLLHKIRDLGLPLISIEKLESE